MAEPRKPKPLLQKEVKFEPGKLLLTAKDLLNLNIGDAVYSFISSVSLKEDSLEEKAWHLIYSAMLRGLKTLVSDSYRLLETRPENVEGLKENIELSLELGAESIGPALFKRPRDLKLLEQIRPSIVAWARTYSLTEQEASIFADRFKSYFAVALFETWAANPSKYELLRKGASENPFSEEQEREHAWHLYQAQLNRSLDNPVFDETFSLRSVYIPLRAGIALTKEEQAVIVNESPYKPEFKVVRTEDWLLDWLRESNTSVRVVSGGPGSGKSTLAKHFAVRAEEQAYKTLFIPLHLMKFDRDLVSAVSDVLSKQFPLKGYNPLETNDVEKLLVVFDGLDELSLSSGQAEQSVTRFVEEVDREARALTTRNVKFLLLGRTLVVQEQQVRALNKAGTILELIPYYVKKDECGKYLDSDSELISVDQRDAWWKRYATIKDFEWQSMPAKLKLSDDHELTEITSQPLLNYLVARKYSDDPDDFDPDQNLNKLYEGLIKEIFERPWGDGGSMHTRGVDERMYFRLLEHVGVCTWHSGDTRTARVKDIESKLPKGSNTLREAFETLGNSVESGATRLLTAFYTQKAEETREGDSTFELTHKSFGEYLTARRIVGVFDQIHRQFTDMESELSPPQLLTQWVSLCGPVYTDTYLKRFVEREVKLADPIKVRAWQDTATKLLNFVIAQHMPVNQVDGMTYKSMLNQDRNAQEALLVFLSCCAGVSNEISRLEFGSSVGIKAWFNFLNSERNFNNSFKSCLNNMDFRGYNLEGLDLSGSNMTGSILTDVNLVAVDLAYSTLESADVSKACLNLSRLFGVDFSYATMVETKILSAFMPYTDFFDANLEEAIIISCDILDSDFAEANLKNTIFMGSDLRRAKNLLAYQLLETKSLYKTILDQELAEEVRRAKPELFEFPKEPLGNFDFESIQYMFGGGNPE